MAITWADVLAIAPDLSGVGATTQVAIVTDVNAQVVEGQFPSVAAADRARKYLAAHLATVSKDGGRGAGGPVQSESMGGVSRSYAVFSPAGADPSLDATAYGKEYRRLLRQLVTRVGVVT